MEITLWILYLAGIPFGYAALQRPAGLSCPDTSDKILNAVYSLLWPLGFVVGILFLAAKAIIFIAAPLEKLAWKLWPKKVDTKQEAL
jgi:hypothetical protein